MVIIVTIMEDIITTMKDATVMAILIPGKIIVSIMKDRTIKKGMTEVTGATGGEVGIN